MKSLLIVDDDPIFLRALSRSMSNLGYQVMAADSIATALDLLNSNKPAFAIVDLHMGAENGNDLIQYLSSHFPSTHSLVLSGYANIPHVVASVRLGAGDCLPKPISAEELDRALRRMAGEKIANPETWQVPDEVRLKHIISYWEKNDRNVSETARKLNMHRRTLQRILRRVDSLNDVKEKETDVSLFQKTKRRYVSQIRALASEN